MLVMLREATRGTRGWEGGDSMVSLAVSFSYFFPLTPSLCVLPLWEYLPYHGIAPPLTLMFPLLFLLLFCPPLWCFLFLKYTFPEVPPAGLRASGVPHGELTGVCCPWHRAVTAASPRDPCEAPAASSGHSHPVQNRPALSVD